MKLASRSASRVAIAAGFAALVLTAAACAPEDDANSADSPDPTTSESGASEPSDSASTEPVDECGVDQLNLIKPGTLTIATDAPAYDPWFSHDDPTNGKGFESATAYAVAEAMGFDADQVTWVVEPFNKSYAPGDKDFDFDINQISITPARAKVVDFSDGYYSAAQAVITLKGTEFADAASLADLKDARIGAQVGTTSLQAVQDVIAPSQQVSVFDDTNAAKQSLNNDQIDAIVTDLPTAFYITAAEIPGSTIVGQFQPTSGETEEFGLLFAKGNPLVACANKAIETLKSDGTLEQIETKWLSSTVNVPSLD